ncbi:MAG: PrsW family intramembrane metalloprotease, partial [Halohasta sp.]
MRLGSRLRQIWRIARWEVSLGSMGLDRRTIAAGVVLVLLAGGIATAAVAGGFEGLSPSQDIYRVGISANSPYYDVVERHAALAPHPPSVDRLERGEIDLLVESRDVGGATIAAGGAGTVGLGGSGPSVSVAHTPTEKGA